MSGKRWSLAADGLPQAITVACPRCGAKVDKECRAIGDEPAAGYHVERIRAVPGRGASRVTPPGPTAPIYPVSPR